jgi:alcohol dehydrogenase
MTMRALRLGDDGLRLEELVEPEATHGSVVVRMQATQIISYLAGVLDGSYGYAVPAKPYTPGPDGIGVVEAVGSGVYHVRPGMRVAIDPKVMCNERVAEPAQVIFGITALPVMRTPHSLEATYSSDGFDPSREFQKDWADGSFADLVRVPASAVTVLPADVDHVPAERLAAFGKFTIAYGALVRGRLQAGETVLVNGATGYLGSGAVAVALAMGAARVVAVGRDQAALQDIQSAFGYRVRIVPAVGDDIEDVRRFREAAGGHVDLAVDMIGMAQSGQSTIAALRSLRRGGRLVLAGSLLVPLPLPALEMMGNDWEVLGCYMYPENAQARLSALVASGLLDLDQVRLTTFGLEDFDKAIDHAGRMRGMDATIIKF